MREMNNEAEKKEKRVKKKGKLGLKEENKLKVGENLEEGERTKEKMAMTVEKNKLKCAHKGDVARFGLEVETEGTNMTTIGGLVPGSEQLSKKTLSWLGSKASARSRSGPWEVNRELTSRTGKLNAKLKKLNEKEKSARQTLKEALVQSDKVSQLRKVRTQEKEVRSADDKLANVEKMPGPLKDGMHRGDEEISAQGIDPSALQTGHVSRVGKPLWKITPNTCGVCSALATKRHYNAWACNACAMFFYHSVTSRVSCRPCLVNLHFKLQFHFKLYIHQFGDKCDTRGRNRTKCQSCRLLKCYEVVK